MDHLGNGENLCLHGDDERFCLPNRTRIATVCWNTQSSSVSDLERFACRHAERRGKRQIPLSTTKTLNEDLAKNLGNSIVSSFSIRYEPYCLRGVDLYVFGRIIQELWPVYVHRVIMEIDVNIKINELVFLFNFVLFPLRFAHYLPLLFHSLMIV